MNTFDIQQALTKLGFSPGPLDGKPGPRTTEAIKAFQTKAGLKPDGIVGPITQKALKDARTQPGPPQPQEAANLIPSAWLPNVPMKGIVFHWTAGANAPSGLDKSHYHILIAGSGEIVRGRSIADNVPPLITGRYAAHTRGHNSNIIGVSLCCMLGAKESPFSAGTQPMRQVQRDLLPRVLAELCRAYRIPVTRKTVLSHAEVQSTLGITQAGKWDITWVPGMAKPGNAIAIGDEIRAEVSRMLA